MNQDHKKRIVLLPALLAIFCLAPSLVPRPACAYDAPHNLSNNIQCNRCHDSTKATADPEWWRNQEINVCGQCHNSAFPLKTGTDVITHRVGTTQVLAQCTVCHNPHYQKQSSIWKADSYLYTGQSETVGGITPTTLTKSGAGWKTDQWKGMMLIPNVKYPAFIYRILSNTATMITIDSTSGSPPDNTINLGYCTGGNQFAIVWGKLVKDSINARSVKFFREEGTYSFADEGTIDGVCQVCHTSTTSFRSNGILEGPGHPAAAGTKCTTCHSHQAGFKADCKTCHGTPPTVNTLGGPDGLATQNSDTGTGATTAGAHSKHAVVRKYTCEACHSGGMPESEIRNNKQIQIGFAVGSFSGGMYNGRASLANGYTYSAGNAGTTVTQNGPTPMQCSNVYCHSKGQSNTGGALAPADYSTPQWNVSSTGQCGTCHDTAAGGGQLSSGSHTKHAGPIAGGGYSFACSTCHNGFSETGLTHADGKVSISMDGRYGGQSNADGQPLQRGFSGSTCTDTYCHSNGTSVATGTVPANTSVIWGSASPGCNSCHGNSVFTDYRKAGPLFASGDPKPNAHQLHIRANASAVTDPSCANCHYTVTTTNTEVSGMALHVNREYNVSASGSAIQYPSWAGTGNGTNNSVALTYAFNSTGSTCSTVSCHPDGLLTQTTKWSDSYLCTDCHGVDMNNTSGYHHVMDSAAAADRSYPSSAPSESASDPGRKCTMCHVDHNVFSPMLNANSPGRSYNLRTDITAIPVPGNSPATGNYANTDFDGSISSGGICVSCHQNELDKNTANRKDDGTTKTPAVLKADFGASAHNYSSNPTSSFISSPNGNFTANCSKCHTTNEPAKFQNSAATFRTHNNPLRRLLTSFAMTAPTDPLEENFCFRCHSTSTDPNPGGGPAKLISGKDYYGRADMSAAAESIFADFQKSTPVETTTDTLFFRETTPSAPAPAGTGSTDTFSGGTWQSQTMLPTQGGGAHQQQVMPSSTPGFWKMTSFVSPPVTAAVNIPAGTWTLRMWAYVITTNVKAKIRAAIYVWRSDNTQGDMIVAPISPGSEVTATASTAYTYSLSGNAVSLNPGDKIVVELEVESTSGSVGTIYYRWNGSGTTDDSRITMPASASFSFISGYGHNITAYGGIHKPSSTDESFSYISANKHVECDDCHSPHAAASGTHIAGTTGNQVSNVLKGVSGAKGAYTNTITTNTLFLRETQPGGPMPDTTDVTSSDAFQGGTWQTRDMLPAQGASAEFQEVTINSNGNPNYWRMTRFISPPVSEFTSIPASQWCMKLWGWQWTTTANAYMRAGIYVWTDADTQGTVIWGPNTYPRSETADTTSPVTELTNIVTGYTWTVNGAPVTLKPGDRIVVELEIETRAAAPTTYVRYRWNGSGTTDDSKLIMPSEVIFLPGAWSVFSYIAGTAQYEYEICFKCHSGANSNVTAWGGTGQKSWTDVALEFNPYNKSAHPVVETLNNQTGSYAPRALTAAQMSDPWKNVGNQTMYCSDCHTTDSAVSSGPHGSSARYMLKGPNTNWPTKSDGVTTYSLRDFTDPPYDSGGLFCKNCHLIYTFGFKNSAHASIYHYSVTNLPVTGGGRCVSCHVVVPHGYKRSRLIGYVNDAQPYNFYGAKSWDSLQIYGFKKASTPSGYTTANCYTPFGCSSKHSNSDGFDP